MPPKNCPVIDLANEILECNQGVLRKIRTFKDRSRTTCRKCELVGRCEKLDYINKSIDISIQEVMIEWGI
jgi:hypothetical protein